MQVVVTFSSAAWPTLTSLAHLNPPFPWCGHIASQLAVPDSCYVALAGADSEPR